MTEVRIGCRACGKKVMMDVMKYDPDNRKILVCPECYSAKVSKKDIKSKTRSLLVSMQGRVRGSNDTGTSEQYKCTNCGYVFKRGSLSRLDATCPYCNKKTSVKKPVIFNDWTKGF